MKLHLISDVHAEALMPHERPVPVVEADVCILAGDICTLHREEAFEDYLRAIKHNFDEVLLVAGNHEFYHTHYDGALERLASLASRTGVRLLDNELGTASFEYKGVKFWGSTLWTDMGEGKYANYVEQGLNDYRLIGGMTAERSMGIHQQSVEAIDWTADVIITHHMPILREHSLYPISPITYGFCCTTLEEKIIQSNIKAWLYGHTHDNTHHQIGNTQLLSNQVGYGRERMKKAYDPNWTINIP